MHLLRNQSSLHKFMRYSTDGSTSVSKGGFSISLLPRKINIGRRPERPFTGVLEHSLAL
ncbi:unnamed protein product [Tetraodon nigroviridis]|uniref:(spotted green pufferfish) hypothetical protein n=1 Tax=Tetraodon nigroviridis TaxID=99883 RepID=Q4S1A4_TETNG|nr:unnamed protein product [Tetraodon nigroviridis]